MNKTIAGVVLAGTIGASGIGCGDDESDGGVSAAGTARFAVVRTDFESTAIAVLNEDGEITDPSIVSSGSAKPGLVAALSGDVVLADAHRGESGVLNILDRFGTDVISRLDLETENILGQLRVAPEAGNFSSNPQDLAVVNATVAWTSRFSVNLDASAEPLARGNDVIELNLINLTLTGRRLDLSRFDATGIAMRDSGPVEVPVFARPGLLAIVDRTLVVGLTLLSFEFDASAPGRVALIDVDTLGVQDFALPTASRNCGSVRMVPGSVDRVMVACSGFAAPFGDEAQLRASSGVYVVRVSGGGAEVIRSWEPRDGRVPLAVTNVVPLDETTFVGVDGGTLGREGDTVWVVDIAAGSETRLFDAAEPFTIGLAAFDPQTGLLLVPDQSNPGGLRRYRQGSGGVFELEEVLTFSDGPLPPYLAYRVP